MSIYRIGDIFTRQALENPQKTALVFNRERYSYAYLDNKINQCASMLISAGLKQGDKAALLCGNAPEFIIAYFAVLKTGAVLVPINTQLKPKGLSYIIENCGAQVLLTNLDSEGFLKETLPALKGLRLAVFLGKGEPLSERRAPQGPALMTWDWRREEEYCPEPERGIIDLDEGVIIYTSGTTGKPKGVVLTHLNILSNVDSVVEYLRLSAKDKALVFLPLFYSYAISQMLTILRAGGTLVLMRDFLFPQRALSLVQQEKVTGLAGVPTTFNILLRISNLRGFDLSSLRYIMNAGGPIYPAVLERLMEAFPGAEIINNYGCSEVAPRATYLDFRYIKEKTGSIGKAIPNVEVRVLNKAGQDAKPGELGEIVIRGSNVMKGYLNNPRETQRALRAEGLHTGDFATVDEEGFIFIKGRKVDIINCGGEKISAKEVEAVLLAHEKVYEAAVIGIPDPILGEAVKAFIAPREPGALSAEEVLAHCAAELAAFKLPKAVEFIKALPKTASGKVRKHLLKDRGGKSAGS